MNQIEAASDTSGQREAERVHRPGQKPGRPERRPSGASPSAPPRSAEHLGSEDLPAAQRSRDQADPGLAEPFGRHPFGGDPGDDQQAEELDHDVTTLRNWLNSVRLHVGRRGAEAVLEPLEKSRLRANR